MNSLTYITLNLQQPNIAAIAYAVQNDRLSRYITAQLVDGSQAWTPPSGSSAMIRYLKPDGTSGFYDTDEAGNPAIVIDGSTATLTLAEQALTVPGDVMMQLNFYTPADEKLTTLSWLLRVQKSVLTDDSIVSTDYYNVLTEQIAAVLNAAESLTGMTASATGLPTGSDPTVNVTGGSGGNPYNLAFGIPAGATGPQGPQGPPGQDGQGSPGTELPLMDGVAAVGTSLRFAHEDHVHPEDTTKAAAADHKLKSYTSVTQIGLTAGAATIATAWTALPGSALLVAPASDFSAASVPSAGGVVEIIKGSAGGWVLYHAADGTVYTGSFSGGAPSGDWALLNSAVFTEAADSGGAWRTTATKHNDGTLICTGYVRFQGNMGVQAINPGFLETFVDSTGPAVTCSVDGGGAGDTSPSVGTVTPSTTALVVYVHTNTGNNGYALRYTAIGRWK